MNPMISKVARYALGLIFFVFGGAGLLQLLPPPPDMPEKLKLFMDGILATGYFFPFLKITETLCGLCLLIGVAPALALIMLAPITLNIFLLHAIVTPGLSNLVLPIVILTLHILAATAYWHIYRPLFKKNP